MRFNTYEKQIVEIDDSKLALVGGGIALGTGAAGIFSPANIAAAGRLVTGLGYLGTAFTVGFAFGTWGYQSYSNYRMNNP